MLFNSLHFLLFLPTVFFLYYVVPIKRQWPLLLLASIYFYASYIPSFTFIIIFIICLDYVLAIEIERNMGSKRKILLIASIIANLGTLFLFKYFNFFSENIGVIAEAIGWNYSLGFLKIALPLGLSFHVFQSLSYVIEVYKKKCSAEKKLGVYALYVFFFPQLVAGPIERPQHLLPQLHEGHRFHFSEIRLGMEQVLWGFFKKLVIADNLSLLVDRVFDDLSRTDGLLIAIGAVAFSYQLYCDFSGYSDIAIGVARMFGIRLTPNFDRPFASKSVAEFWQRWHISLSSWLREYLYYPLVFAGKKITPFRIYVGTVVTFVLIGLWHGPNWTFVIMGLLHGVYLSVSLLTASTRGAVYQRIGLVIPKEFATAWKICFVFILVTISFLYFRAPTVTDATESLVKIASLPLHTETISYSIRDFFTPKGIGIGAKQFILVCFAIGIMEYIQMLQSRRSDRRFPVPSSRRLRWAWYYSIVLMILLFGHFTSVSFIYFQF